MQIRIHFSKTGFASFISHIDLPMLFGRAARRAGLAAEMTQGFSPHPKLALASPLPVGVMGLCEPADFWFDNWSDDSLQRWRAAMPEGIDILHAHPVSGDSPVKLHKLCTAASYSFELCRRELSAQMVSGVLDEAMKALDALLKVEMCDREVRLSVNNTEQGGASYMVKSLIAGSAVDGWSDIRVTRTAVGRWSRDEMRVIPLMEEVLR